MSNTDGKGNYVPSDKNQPIGEEPAVNVDVEKAAEEKYPDLKLTRTQSFHVEKLREAFIAGSKWSADEKDKEITRLTKANTQANCELITALEEVGRLKGLIEQAHKEGYPNHVTDDFKEAMWQQFKTENNLS